jgi:hypothetical protein
MQKQKTILISILVILGLSFLIAFYFITQKTLNPEIETTSQATILNPVIQETPVTATTPEATEEEKNLEALKKIMNDNVTGTVEKVNLKYINIKADDGTIKTMPMAEGKTFVISQTKNTMVGKKISDIKVGMKAFVHFEKETNLATTITLLQ